MTLFCTVIKILKYFRLSSKLPEQSVTTLQYPCHSWSQQFRAGKPFFHVSSWSATVGERRHSGDAAVIKQNQSSVYFHSSVSLLIYITVTLHRQALTTIPLDPNSLSFHKYIPGLHQTHNAIVIHKFSSGFFFDIARNTPHILMSRLIPSIQIATLLSNL